MVRIIINFTPMGSIISTPSESKTTLLAMISTLSIMTYVVHSAIQKKNERKNILNAINQEKAVSNTKENKVYLEQQEKNYYMRSNQKYPVYKIVVTGGPCGGKSTSFDRIHKIFTEKGFRVLCVPEINTMVVLAGVTNLIPHLTQTELLNYEALLIRFQIFTEDYFVKLAMMANQPAIVLCDRGTVDAYAYVSDESFQAIMDK